MPSYDSWRLAYPESYDRDADIQDAADYYDLPYDEVTDDLVDEFLGDLARAA